MVGACSAPTGPRPAADRQR
uniref:Uncharacterized protein n=1 Tax=Arundo donax TaxID=35708 RepID=A0A0A9F5G3_ARUDO